jgi:hypothetical protein
MKWAGLDNLNPYVFYCSKFHFRIVLAATLPMLLRQLPLIATFSSSVLLSRPSLLSCTMTAAFVPLSPPSSLVHHTSSPIMRSRVNAV